MAVARARKAFKYPDEDANDAADAIDEEEQEKLISSIAARDASQTRLYTLAFLVLPLALVILYAPTVLHPPSGRALAQSLCCIYTLGHAAFSLFCLGPLTSTAQLWRRRPGDDITALSVVPLLTALFGACLPALQAAVADEGDRLWPPGWVPAVVWCFVAGVRCMLRPVDVEGLARLRYGYKGA